MKLEKLLCFMCLFVAKMELSCTREIGLMEKAAIHLKVVTLTQQSLFCLQQLFDDAREEFRHDEVTWAGAVVELKGLIALA